MITPRSRTVTVIRHELRIDSPATQKDVYDTILQASQHMKAEGRDATYDDAIMVEARDDEIVVHWTEEKSEW